MKVIVCLKLAILTFFFLTCSNSKQIPPKAEKGVLDLREWDFSPSEGAGDVAIKLDGEWEFYPFVLPDENGELPRERKHFIEVPRSWNGYAYKDEREENKDMTGVGYGSYRIKILSNAPEVSLKAPTQGTAFSIFCGKEKKLQSGTVGKDEYSSQPSRRINDPITCYTVQGELILTLIVSNFHDTRGGYKSSLFLGTHQEILRKREGSLSLELFLAGILFIMGSYHISLFYLRREDRSALFFGAVCLLISLRTLITGESYLSNLFPSISYVLGNKLEYLTLYLGLLVFLEFISSLYPLEINLNLHKILHWICMLLSIFVVISSTLSLSKTLPFFQFLLLISIIYALIILVRAIRNHRSGAKTFLFGFIFFSFTLINDIMYNNHIVDTGYYSSFGLVVFILSQSFLLSSRFANAFHLVKDLTLNLEQKVEECTRTLEEANRQIEDSRKEIEELNIFIQNINSVPNLTDMMMFVIYYLETNFGYNTFWLVLHDKNANKLNTVFCVSSTLPEENVQYLKSLSLHPEDSLSVCSTFQKQVPLFLSKDDPKVTKRDKELSSKVDLSYLFHLPFVIYGDCFGILTLHKEDGLNVPQNEQTKMSRFTELISGSFYNSILYRNSQVAKEEAEKALKEIEKAYHELQETQAQLVEAERMASLGQLVGSIAHEINNPIGVIRSQSEQLARNIQATLDEIPQFLESGLPPKKRTVN
jgi:hypothetical protein